MALEREYRAFRDKLGDSEWAAKNHGKYVLVKEDKVIQTFDSYGDALRGGYDRFGLGAFLVKQASAMEQAHFISRLWAPCPISPSR